MQLARTLAIAALAIACSGGGDDADPTRTPTRKMSTAAPVAAPIDAGVVETAPPVAAPTGPEDGWLDPTPESGTWKPSNSAKRKRERHMVYIQLRSSPAGATVMIDGQRVGVTPTYWEGETDGKAHDFVFILEGYKVEHYRFVPVTSGHLNAPLKKLIAPQKPDAGVAEKTAREG
jgi:hypothetical protein